MVNCYKCSHYGYNTMSDNFVDWCNKDHFHSEDNKDLTKEEIAEQNKFIEHCPDYKAKEEKHEMR